MNDHDESSSSSSALRTRPSALHFDSDSNSDSDDAEPFEENARPTFPRIPLSQSSSESSLRSSGSLGNSAFDFIGRLSRSHEIDSQGNYSVHRGFNEGIFSSVPTGLSLLTTF